MVFRKHLNQYKQMLKILFAHLVAHNELCLLYSKWLWLLDILAWFWWLVACLNGFTMIDTSLIFYVLLDVILSPLWQILMTCNFPTIQVEYIKLCFNILRLLFFLSRVNFVLQRSILPEEQIKRKGKSCNSDNCFFALNIKFVHFYYCQINV